MKTYRSQDKCLASKIPYTSEAEARKFIKTVRINKKMDKKQRPYLCPFLLNGKIHWHTTSLSKHAYKHKKRYEDIAQKD